MSISTSIFGCVRFDISFNEVACGTREALLSIQGQCPFSYGFYPYDFFFYLDTVATFYLNYIITVYKQPSKTNWF